MQRELTKEELKILDTEHNQEHYAKIEVLNEKEELISSIQGRITTGSLQVNADSSLRRTCSLTFVAEETESIENVDNLLSINKRVKIYEGLANDGLLPDRPDIIWFKLGVFVIASTNYSHSTSGLNISITCQDKMCLLNGTQGGNLPTSITFDSYDQVIGYLEVDALPQDPNTYTVYYYNGKYYKWSGANWEESSYAAVGSIESIPQRFFDIIQTLVCNYGGIPISKIFIDDVPLEIKQIVRFTGTGTLYHNNDDKRYTMDKSVLKSSSNPGVWSPFEYNDDCGYVYTDFVFPGSLVSSIGDNVCTVLDKVKQELGNYEYFFDIDGNFHFQEIKNYLNNSYDPVEMVSNNEASILNNDNYLLDVKSNSKVEYSFREGNGLVASYTNAPNYANIKNDYHVWGKNKDDAVIHYHVAIKRKPTVMNAYPVVFEKNDMGEYTGRLRLATQEEMAAGGYRYSNNTITSSDGSMIASGDTITMKRATYNELTKTITLTGTNINLYVPADWRAELYLQGLVKQSQQIRPDVYEQELLDLFDDIYNFQTKSFKADLTTNPNELKYFFDYIEPADKIYDYSVDLIGTRIKSYQQDKIRRLYNEDIPDVIMINMDDDNADKNVKKCSLIGQTFSRVSNSIYKNIAIGTIGYTAQEVMRDLLYQYTSYNEQITLQCIPIYHLEANSRITVNDIKSRISGDFIIKSFTLPLGGNGMMSISASRALERI